MPRKKVPPKKERPQKPVRQRPFDVKQRLLLWRLARMGIARELLLARLTAEARARGGKQLDATAVKALEALDERQKSACIKCIVELSHMGIAGDRINELVRKQASWVQLRTIEKELEALQKRHANKAGNEIPKEDLERTVELVRLMRDYSKRG